MIERLSLRTAALAECGGCDVTMSVCFLGTYSTEHMLVFFFHDAWLCTDLCHGAVGGSLARFEEGYRQLPRPTILFGSRTALRSFWFCFCGLRVHEH